MKNQQGYFRSFILLLLMVAASQVIGQLTVSGTVSSQEDQLGIIGATILEKGTANGALTDENGNYSISVSENATLVFSYIGMANQEIAVNGRTTIDVVMAGDAYQLDDVVVTAFGIEKEKKALGFSVGEIDGEELTKAKEINFATQLVGKIPGLDITKPSNGPSGATRIVIRGLSQLQGENRPLIVLDGIPLDNTNVGSAGLFGGRDSGDGLAGVNSDDIENISVLKGPSASALYGSRAGNGVIVITTKKGTKRKGIGIEYSSNFVTEEVMLIPKHQQEYGQGAGGEKPTTQAEAFDNWESWGSRLDGSLTPIFNGELLPYAAVGEADTRSYYQRGNTWTNSLSMTGGNETISSRLSLSALSNNGIIPNTTYDRYTVNLNTRVQLTDALSFDGKINFVQEDSENRINLTDYPTNPAKYFVIGPANLPHSVFEKTRDAAGNPIYWSDNPFTQAPYWGTFENVNRDTKKKFLGYFSARWQILPWLSAQGRVGTEENTQSYFSVEIDGTQYDPLGLIGIDDYTITERNYDFIVNANRTLNKDFDVDLTLGAVRTNRSLKISRILGREFINPGFISINNMANQQVGDVLFVNSRVNALFATSSVSFRNYLYAEASVRNDYFSVLTNPQNLEDDENSILYVSGSLSFIASDAFKMPEWVSYAKLRLGVGTSGLAQIEPYSQVGVYEILAPSKGTATGAVTQGQIRGDRYPNPFLKPSRTKSFEIGTDLRFLRNRLGIDFTYYRQVTDRHIFDSPLPASTGYGSILINAGEVENQGIELLLTGKIWQTKDFSWEASFNFAKNTNNVIALNDGIAQLDHGVDRSFSANVISRTGGSIGDIWGDVYDRNAAGEIIHGADGLPQIAEEREILGNFNPDWYGGFSSTFSYKNISLSFLIDTKQGGEILSTTSSFGYLFGTHVNSLDGRENPDFMIVSKGVGPDGVTANQQAVRLDNYYERLSIVAENNVYDASYIKFRQLSVSYTFDRNFFEKVKFIEQITVSAVGRNLFFISNGLDEIGLDPEAIYTATGIDAGLEYAALPSTRSYGFTVQVKF